MPVVIQTLTPVLAIVAIGFLLAGRRRQLDLTTLADVVLLVASPALIFSSLAETSLDPLRWGRVLAGTLWIMTGTGALISIYVWRQGAQFKALIPPTVFWNAGNMALPFSQLAFGQDGLDAAIIIFATSVILQFSIGIKIARGQGGWAETLRLPPLYAIIGGAVVGGIGFSVPEIVMRPIQMVGAMAIPLLLVSLGAQLRRLRISDFRHSIVSVAVRMGGGLTLALLFVHLFGIVGVERQVLLLSGVLPAAVVNVIIAERYGSNPNLVASTVLLGTLVSLVTVPILIYLIA
jgi:predicted permease